jgi:hypothetical protein
MSNWIVITQADLYNSKAAALIDAANSSSLGAGQTDRITGVIADVTLEVRRRVAKCNQLDQNTAAIPGGLKPLAVDLIFCRLKTALEMELTEDERLSLKQRELQLDRIADGRDVVEPPDSPMAVNPLQFVPEPGFGHRRPREFTNRTQNG